MKTRILIVEDDPHILMGLEEVLRTEGFEVTTCARGAIKRWRRWPSINLA
jgi:DNA-binding response OmpR family regulator